MENFNWVRICSSSALAGKKNLRFPTKVEKCFYKMNFILVTVCFLSLLWYKKQNKQQKLHTYSQLKPCKPIYPVPVWSLPPGLIAGWQKGCPSEDSRPVPLLAFLVSRHHPHSFLHGPPYAQVIMEETVSFNSVTDFSVLVLGKCIKHIQIWNCKI